MKWKTHNQLLEEIKKGPVDYGCARLGKYRRINSAYEIPSQEQIDADEKECEELIPSGISASEVRNIALEISNEAVVGMTAKVETLTNSFNTQIQNVSIPIPTTIFTGTYQAKIDDQRILHVGTTDGNLILLPASQVQFRRFVCYTLNSAKFTLKGTFIGVKGIYVDPVIPSGGSVEVISNFVPSVDGSTNAPTNLRLNGSLVASGTRGDWKYSIVTTHFGAPTSADWLALSNKVTALEAISPIVGPRGEKGETGSQGIPGVSGIISHTYTTSSSLAVGTLKTFDVTVNGATTSMVATVNSPDASLVESLSDLKATVIAPNTVRIFVKPGVPLSSGTKTFNIRVIP
jgi:hypothetical protein